MQSRCVNAQEHLPCRVRSASQTVLRGHQKQIFRFRVCKAKTLCVYSDAFKLLNAFLNAFDAMQCTIPKRAFMTVFFLAATRDTPIQVPTEIVVTAWNVRQRSFCTWTCAIQEGFAKHRIFLCYHLSHHVAGPRHIMPQISCPL